MLPDFHLKKYEWQRKMLHPIVVLLWEIDMQLRSFIWKILSFFVCFSTIIASQINLETVAMNNDRKWRINLRYIL